MPLESEPKTIGERIYATRKAWGWSQKKLSIYVGVDQASVSLWEHDKIFPSGSAIVALCALLGCSALQLTTGHDFMDGDWNLSEAPADIPVFRLG